MEVISYFSAISVGMGCVSLLLHNSIFKDCSMPYNMSMENVHTKALKTMRGDYGVEWRKLK